MDIGIHSLFRVSLAGIKMCGKPSDSPLLAEDNPWESTTVREKDCASPIPLSPNMLL